MAHELPALPYAHDALEPHIDKATMEIHHGRHHKAYVDNLNKAIAGNAALGAARKAKAKILEAASAKFGAAADELEMRGGYVVRAATGD